MILEVTPICRDVKIWVWLLASMLLVIVVMLEGGRGTTCSILVVHF